MGEEIFVKLRDCFTAGYTLPQYCIDNGIRKPLFVSEKKYELFLWEVYVQFHYDKRLTPQFCFMDTDKTEMYFPSYSGLIAAYRNKNFSSMNLNDFDKIIFLTAQKPNAANKAIYLNSLNDYFIRKAYCEIPLLKFLQRHPGVKLFLTFFPLNKCRESAEFHSSLCSVGQFTERLRKDTSGNVKTTLDKFGYTNKQVLEISTSPGIKKHPDGTTTLIEDANKPLLRIQNGKRATAHQPEKFRNRIYFFGQCVYYGIYASFDKTLESYLQQMLNDHNLPYRVENESQFCYNRTHDILYNLNAANPVPGDIIFVILEGLHANNDVIPFVDINDVFDAPQDYKEIFCVKSHVNELGYKLMAEKYFKFLTENNFFRDKEFVYPPPVNHHSATVYLRNSRRAA